MFIWPRGFNNSLCNLLFEIFIPIPHLNRRVVYASHSHIKMVVLNLYHFVRTNATFHYKVTVFPLTAEDNGSKLGGWRVKWKCVCVCVCVQINIHLSGRRSGERIAFTIWNLMYPLDICPFLGQIRNFLLETVYVAWLCGKIQKISMALSHL